MIQRGIISAIDNDIVWVAALSEKDEEQSCNVGGCSSGCSCNVTGQIFKSQNSRNLPLKEGDKVEVVAKTSSIGIGLLLVLGLPILFGLLSWWGFPRLIGEAAQPWMALAGICFGFAVALFFSWKEKEFPEVNSILL
ncbi:MAG: SoxR reducing system RseC family protein [Spirochaetaceae bacterium]|jgi:positive regulator of sigma E activity|nr:SoxR reducing system RseC family protein [Spirochaetaceae bacterium]